MSQSWSKDKGDFLLALQLRFRDSTSNRDNHTRNRSNSSIPSTTRRNIHRQTRKQSVPFISKRKNTTSVNKKKKGISSSRRSGRRNAAVGGGSCQPCDDAATTTTTTTDITTNTHHMVNTLKKKDDCSIPTRGMGAYTMVEDLAILDFIVTHNAYNLISGKSMWIEMERLSESRRTWQSLKERFRKRIMLNLENYNLSPKVIEHLQAKKEIPEPKKRNKRSEFTADEDACMLDFISTNTRHGDVGGNYLWQEMAKKCKGLENHTWHSLKNRFFKKILHDLDKYNLTQEEKLLFTNRGRQGRNQAERNRNKSVRPHNFRKTRGYCATGSFPDKNRKGRKRWLLTLDSVNLSPKTPFRKSLSSTRKISVEQLTGITTPKAKKNTTKAT